MARYKNTTTDELNSTVEAQETLKENKIDSLDEPYKPKKSTVYPRRS